MYYFIIIGIGLLILLNGFDVISTIELLKNNDYYEANPFLRILLEESGIGSIILVKFTFICALVVFFFVVKKEREKYLLILGLWFCVFYYLFFMIYYNLRFIILG